MNTKTYRIDVEDSDTPAQWQRLGLRERAAMSGASTQYALVRHTWDRRGGLDAYEIVVTISVPRGTWQYDDACRALKAIGAWPPSWSVDSCQRVAGCEYLVREVQP